VLDELAVFAMVIVDYTVTKRIGHRSIKTQFSTRRHIESNGSHKVQYITARTSACMINGLYSSRQQPTPRVYVAARSQINRSKQARIEGLYTLLAAAAASVPATEIRTRVTNLRFDATHIRLGAR
jgi:hypothetical protein